MADDNSTGHVFDEDLVEMNNPLPMWWVVLFVLTVVFSLAYVYFFPGLGAAQGSLGWTSRGELAADQGAAAEAMAKVYAPYAQLNAEAAVPGRQGDGDRPAPVPQQLLELPRLGRARQQGLSRPHRRRLAATAARRRRSRRRSPTAATAPCRRWPLPVGSAADVRDVANYVLSLSGDPHNPIAASSGRKKFVACAACHAPRARATRRSARPTWPTRSGCTAGARTRSPTSSSTGKSSVMPAQAGRLTPEQIHLLASYVWSLSQTRRTASR
jgi:cytochrome c oxidase cbb3-type subunit 3